MADGHSKNDESNRADESYLDSLLSSVTPVLDTDPIAKKKNVQTTQSLIEDVPKDYNIFDLPEDETAVSKEENVLPKEEVNHTEKESFSDSNQAVKTEEELQPEEEVHIENDDDILELINQINNSQELPNVEDTADYKNVDLHTNSKDLKSEGELEEDVANNDVGKVFSSALAAVSSLEDEVPQQTLDPVRKKQGFLSRIFGNVKVKKTPEEIEAEKKKAQEQEEKEKKKQEKREEKKKLAKEKKNSKKQVKASKEKPKKKEKVKKSKEAKQISDDFDDEDDSRINKVGATIIFTFFAATAVVIVLGTNLYSYAVSIKHATSDFNIKRYNEAYNNVYGIDIKKEDLEIYDKIMTVMYVNKQLNSYNNYCNMKKYPEALDSLLKGLERYDKYYMLANLLHITNDLDYVKKQIVTQLQKTFLMTEEEARVILLLDDQAEYSSAVYAMAQERVGESENISDKGETSK